MAGEDNPMLVCILLEGDWTAGSARTGDGFGDRDLCVDQLSFGSGEQLGYDAVRAGCEYLPNPLATLVIPVHLEFAAFKVDGAQVVLCHFRFRNIDMDGESGDGGVRIFIDRESGLTHRVERQRHGLTVFSVEDELSQIRENLRNLGSLKGSFPRHHQALMVEKNLVGKGIPQYFHVDGSIAGNEALVGRPARGSGAYAAPGNDTAADSFAQRHGTCSLPDSAKGLREQRLLWQVHAFRSAAYMGNCQVLVRNQSRFSGRRAHSMSCAALIVFTFSGGRECLLRTG